MVYTYGNLLLQAYQTYEEPTATSTYETYSQTHHASGVATYQNSNSVFQLIFNQSKVCGCI